MAYRPVRPARWILGLITFGLFLVWSNSFIAIGYLLGSDGAVPRTDWISLTTVRFLPAALVCLLYLILRRRKESLAMVGAYWRRLLLCSVFGVPVYNLALYYGQANGVSAPIASLTTTLLPIFVLLLATAFLGERMTRAHFLGLLVSILGMVLVGTADQDGPTRYSLMVALVALAPLSWSIYSVASKAVTAKEDPLLWTYLMVTVGTLMVAPFLGLGSVREDIRSLDLAGWNAVLYLSWPCTVLGFAVWTWLLKHIQASTLGMAVFLNPPLTTVSKMALAALLPETFEFHISLQEFLGGGIALLGVLIVALRRQRASQPVSFRS